jgi:hypothetical protein
MPLIREIVVDAKSGVQSEAWVESPSTLTPEQGLALQQEADRQAANGRSLEQQATDAIASLRAYRDLASPTNAQTVAAVKLLCRVGIALIRLHLRKFDAAD